MMNKNLKGFIEKTISSLIPWFFISLIFVFFLSESLTLSLLMGSVVVVIIFLIKRQIVKNKQKHAIRDFVKFCEISKDNTKISFDETGEWCTGLMETSNVKFFCMVNVDNRLLRMKLPTLYRKKMLTIDKNLIKLVCKKTDEGRVLIEIGPHNKEIIIPWRESFKLSDLP